MKKTVDPLEILLFAVSILRWRCVKKKPLKNITNLQMLAINPIKIVEKAISLA